MVKKKTVETMDKQTRIKTYMRNLFLLNQIIDESGNILDLKRFQELIKEEIKQCQKEMAENETINGVVKDQMLQSFLIGDLEYLQSLAKHTKNINPMIEYPIQSREDMQKKQTTVLFPRLKLLGIIVKDRIGNWLQH